MTTATLTREVTGTFAQRDDDFYDDYGSLWDYYRFTAEDGAYARASLKYQSAGERSVWGVKVEDEQHRGRGLGTAVMSNIVALAEQEGWDLWLWCEPAESGEWIVAFYERFGFSVDRISDNGIVVMSRNYMPNE